MPSELEPTVYNLTRAQLEAQLASAVERRCWWAEDAIRSDLRSLAALEQGRKPIVEIADLQIELDRRDR